MMSPKVKLGLLLTTHIVCGVVLGWLVRTMESDYGFWGLYTLEHADVALLGMWAGLSTARLAWRVIAVIVVTVYMLAGGGLGGDVSFGWHVSLPDEGWNVIWSSLGPIAIFGILSAWRLSRLKAQLVQMANAPPLMKNNQFTIRHVLLATAVVASVLGLGRAIRTLTGGDPDYWWALLLELVCETLASLVILWASLGLGRPLLRLPIGLLMASVLMFIAECLHYEDDMPFVYTSFVVLPSIIIIAASLLVFRSCGWRLVSGVQPDKQLMSGDQGSGTATPSI